MKPRVPLPIVFAALAACSGEPNGPAPQERRPPPPPLRSLLVELKALAATLTPPAAEAQRELRELGDVALQLVEAEARTAARADRALREHEAAWWVLEPALAHERVEVRRRAAWLCGQSGQTVLQVPLLLRFKYEQDAETVVWVADALVRLGNDTGLAWLDAAIGNEATREQAGAAAVEALRARKVPLTEQPTWDEVRERLRERTVAWERTGECTLAGLTPPPTGPLEARLAAQLLTTEGTLLRPIDDAKFILVRAGKLSVPLLTRVLVASEPYLRSTALELLARIGLPAAAAAPAVLPLLDDPLTGSYAVLTLGEIGATDALPRLRPFLGERDTELRAAATRALGLLRDEASRAALRGKLDDANEAMDVRVGAAFGLLCFDADAKAEAFLAEREAKKDYHEPMLLQLRERLAALRR
jgi:hypothetical protein